VNESDKGIDSLSSALGSMLERLKTKIDKTEEAVGDKLRLLDIDNDGEISVDELRHAMESLLRSRQSSSKTKHSTTSTNGVVENLESCEKTKTGDINNTKSETKKIIDSSMINRNTTTDELLKLLDADGDGKVSVSELMKYVADRRGKQEIETFEAQVKRSSTTPPVTPSMQASVQSTTSTAFTNTSTTVTPNVPSSTNIA
jgi:Ca2+-binding EF-hand superfamily protein